MIDVSDTSDFIYPFRKWLGNTSLNSAHYEPSARVRTRCCSSLPANSHKCVHGFMRTIFMYAFEINNPKRKVIFYLGRSTVILSQFDTAYCKVDNIL